MTIHYSDTFLKDYLTLPKPVRKKFKRQMATLSDRGVTYRSLGARKMTNTSTIWEARIDIHFRFTFQMQGEQVLMRRIGTHTIYKKP
jgi:mRNA-degrading endonuclease RelE of RelBE toxin-antitoxin system